MESRTLLTQQISSIHGHQTLHPIPLDPTTQQLKPSYSSQTILQVLPTALQHGDLVNNRALENQQMNKLPTAEQIQCSEVPPPRTFTLSYEEFYQWRQVLGQFKQSIQKEGNS